MTPEKSRLASDVDNCKIIGPWLGFGVKGLDELLGDWDGVGVLEIAGPRKVGKSVSNERTNGSSRMWLTADIVASFTCGIECTG